MPVIQYLIAVDGITTRVLESGPGRERGRGDIVLIHGIGARADRWRRNIDALAEAGYRVVAFDLPGHGLAQKGELPYSVPFYSTYLGRLVEALAMDPAQVVLVGTSLGGHVAAHAAVHWTGFASRLVLVGAVGLLPLGETVRRTVGASVLDTSRTGTRAKLRRVLADPALVTDDLVEEEYRVNTSPGADDAVKILSRYFRDHIDDDVVGPALAARDTPTLLVWGARDRTVHPDIGVRAQALLGTPPLSIIDGAAHAPYFERPQAFNRIVLDFLTNGARP